MQDQYVGDVGDFGKYGLLRRLCGMTGADGRPALSLGVVWYRVPNEGGNDGKNLSYLDPLPKNLRRFGECDQPLYDALFDIVYDRAYPIVQRVRRNVQAVRKSGVLPAARRAFYERWLTFDDMPNIGAVAREKRLQHRRRWIERAVAATDDCDVVFVDPDNGLQIPSTKRHHKRGPKYVFFRELRRYAAKERRPGLVIYQHMNHSPGRVEHQIQKRLLQIVEELDGYATPFALQFRTSRFFFVVPTKAQEAILLQRAESLTQKPWDEHFNLVHLQTP